MKGFKGRFKQFYIKKGRKLLRFPSSTALFKREVLLLFREYRKYLVDNFQSTKGLKLKGFESILQEEGFLLVTSKR